ncbi:MAG: type II 3-dehydroquinate dehydratase [Clostridia bacterium]|nr:type II 3-dehydroquinate dehydratase [Clostridia bacterium]
MKLLILNGPNLNMVGIREPNLYGDKRYKELVKEIKLYSKEKKIKSKVFQSNYEGKLIDKIQKAYKKYDGIIINAGAYSHTSIAILDALKSVNIPVVEVHLTNISAREEFRKNSYISSLAKKVIMGKGFNGYIEAIDYFVK